MALWFDLMVNADCIGRVEVQRVHGAVDGHHTYRWRIQRGMMETREPWADYRGSVEHYEGDGALVLLARVLECYHDALGAGT